MLQTTLILMLAALPGAGKEDEGVAVKKVSLAELQKTIESHRGKVVLVHFWNRT